jgi:hypothetical protein
VTDEALLETAHEGDAGLQPCSVEFWCTL